MAKKNRKKKILDLLGNGNNISSACESLSISRNTFYRWLGEDDKFNENVEFAQLQGNMFIDDMSENQLIKKIKEGNMSAIRYRLSRTHIKYQKKKYTIRLDGGNSIDIVEG